jgi:hypothetical protein
MAKDKKVEVAVDEPAIEPEPAPVEPTLAEEPAPEPPPVKESDLPDPTHELNPDTYRVPEAEAEPAAPEADDAEGK